MARDKAKLWSTISLFSGLWLSFLASHMIGYVYTVYYLYMACSVLYYPYVMTEAIYIATGRFGPCIAPHALWNLVGQAPDGS